MRSREDAPDAGVRKLGRAARGSVCQPSRLLPRKARNCLSALFRSRATLGRDYGILLPVSGGGPSARNCWRG